MGRLTSTEAARTAGYWRRLVPRRCDSPALTGNSSRRKKTPIKITILSRWAAVASFVHGHQGLCSLENWILWTMKEIATHIVYFLSPFIIFFIAAQPNLSSVLALEDGPDVS